MNLQDTECLKISAQPRSTIHRGPRSDTSTPFILHSMPEPKLLLFLTPRAGKIWLTLNGLASSICGDEVFLANPSRR